MTVEDMTDARKAKVLREHRGLLARVAETQDVSHAMVRGVYWATHQSARILEALNAELEQIEVTR